MRCYRKLILVSTTSFCLIGMMALTSCTPEVETPEKIAVEGWIQEGEHPVVLLHQTYSMTSEEHQEDIDANTSFDSLMLAQMIPHSRVAIHDGEQEYVLAGRVDTRYMPPIVFSTTDMVGQVGKTYRLNVDYKDKHAAGTTTLLPTIPFDSITVELSEATKCSFVTIYISQLPDEDCYFVVQYRKAGSTQFLLCPFGVKAWKPDEEESKHLAINVYLQTGSLINSQSFPTSKTQYTLRLARIDRTEYDFFMGLSVQLMSQGLFYVPIYGNIPSNIVGGVGYWAGLGNTDCTISTEKNRTFFP